MPTFFGHAKEQARLIQNLTTIYHEIARSKGLPLGDFPDPKMMQERFADMDFSTFSPLDPKKLAALEELLAVDLPKLLKLIPEEQARAGVQSAALAQVGGTASPFAVLKVGGADERSVFQAQWLVPPDQSEYEAEFKALGPVKGMITGQQAKEQMIKSRLPSNVLHSIWHLADCDQDGMLTLAEYALAMHLIKMKADGQDLPTSLPPEMVPLATADS